VARRETGPGWTSAEMEGYLRRFQYRLGPQELEGMARFESLLQQHGLLVTD
jgi:predicted solute-binding protein